MGEHARLESVLIVEDDRLTRSAYRRVLEYEYGARVSEASNVPEATKAATATQYDLCIVDHHLPDGAGLEVVKTLRASQPAARIALITAYGSMTLAIAAIRAGADDALEKPVTVAEIVRRVGNAPPANTTSDAASLDQIIWDYVQRVVADCQGNRSEAARQLRIDRGTLHRWLSRPRPPK